MARKPIFVFEEEDNKPVCIYFDHSLSRQIREEWTIRVEKYGGAVVRDSADANFVICSKTSDIFSLRAFYAASKKAAKREVIVKSLDFLEACIHEERLVEIEERPKGMSGRIHDTPRVPFTEKDDHELAWYLAAVVPEPSAGGRRGNNLYKNLVKLGNVKHEYAWAKRHTWESWRNRYNKNRERFDLKIESLVPLVNPNRTHHLVEDRRVNMKRFEEEEEGSENESDKENHGKDNERQDPDKTEDTEEDSDDSQPGPSNKGKGRAPPEDDEEEDRRSERNEGEGNADNATPPPPTRKGEANNDYWENFEPDDFQPPMDLDEPPADYAPPPGSAERHARFAAEVGSRSSPVEKAGSPSRRRRLSEESSSNKRPRLSGGSATSSQSGIRGARLPPGMMPGAKADSDPEDDEDDEDEDDDEPDSEALGVTHSLFSDGELELDEDEEDQLDPDLDPAPAPAAEAQVVSGASAGSSTVYPISGDRTLVASASPRKQTAMSPRKLARLSSASRKEEYLPMNQAQGVEIVAMNVIVVSDDEEMSDDATKDQEKAAEPENPTQGQRTRSPSIEVVAFQPKARTESVEAPEPTAQTSRDRRRRAERQLERAPAPTRMTRSRSQSVEPTEFVSLPLGSSKRKGKGKAKVVEPEPEIIEEVDEDMEEEPLADPEEYVPGKETLVEEEDVANIVTNPKDFSSVFNLAAAQQQNAGSNNSSKTISRPSSPAQPSSDDEQTVRRIAAQHQKLRATSVGMGPRKADALIEAFKLKAEQVKIKTESRPSRLPFNALMRNPPTVVRSASAHQRGSDKKKTPRPYKAPQTPTPVGAGVKQSSRRRETPVASGSDEASESIPMPGTRAKAFRSKIEQEERYTPYTPPAGTRASQYSQDRPTGQSSQRR